MTTIKTESISDDDMDNLIVPGILKYLQRDHAEFWGENKVHYGVGADLWLPDIRECGENQRISDNEL